MTIERNGSAHDIIKPFDLRPTRTKLDILPFPITYHSRYMPDPYSAQASYYQNNFPDGSDRPISVSKQVIESGIPKIKSKIPGINEFSSVVTFDANIADEVPILIYNGTSVCVSGYYNANTVVKKIVDGLHSERTVMCYNLEG